MSIRVGCRERRINKESVHQASSGYQYRVRSELASTLVVHFGLWIVSGESVMPNNYFHFQSEKQNFNIYIFV